MRTIAIIWAGAAGLMTAAIILEDSKDQDFHIHLFDKNHLPWRKVALSGGGRCNLTTGIEDKKLLFSKYTRGSEFIRKALGKFSPRKCREWFESHKLPLKMELDYRVFPDSDDGLDVVEVFESIFIKHRDKISLHYDEGVSEVSLFPSRIQENEKQNMDSSLHPKGISPPRGLPIPLRGKGVQLHFLSQGTHSEWQIQEETTKQFIITTPKWVYESDILVITTGGNAYSHTGSSGDGYAFARALWHTITQLWPSLSSFLTGEKWMHELSGLAFEHARIWELAWPLLLTHFGISWPLTFQLSSHLAWKEIRSEMVYFSPIAEMDFTSWNTFLKKQFELHPKKLITNILAEKLPRRFAEAFVEEYFRGLKEIFAASISRDDREIFSKLLGEGIPLTLLERRPGDEFVTAGWVEISEVDPETMESRIQKNLYFAGEVLNVDAVTWWFNLQACWAGGYSIGKDILQKITQRD